MSLIEAARQGEVDRARALLEQGANVDERDEHGWTSLDWAAGRGDAPMVRVLLERGADATSTGRDLRTALMIAQAAGRSDVVEILAEAEKAKGVWRDPRETHPYCKAYYLGDLRRFAGWSEDEGSDGSEAAGDDAIVYLHQDFTVTRSMWHGEERVFTDVTPDWKRFCEEALGFSIPDDLL